MGGLASVAARTWAIVIDLLGDTIAAAVLIGCIVAIGRLLDVSIDDPTWKMIFKLTHIAGGWVIFVLFLWKQVRKYASGGPLHVFVAS
jgi:hypothetical protein